MKTYIVKSMHDIYRDSFTEGEGAHVNYFDLETKQTATTYKEAVVKHLNELNYDLGAEDLEVDEESNTLQTGCTVGADNERPDQATVDAWKKGEAILYVARITLEIFEVTPVKL